MTITEVKGQHLESQLTNHNVDRLFFLDNLRMNYIPVGYLNFFPNLNNLWIGNSPIEEIYQTDFETGNNLTIFGMRNTKITKLSSDIFINVKNLQSVYLYNNRLKFINENAFKTNSMLRIVDFHDNELEYLTRIFNNNPFIEDIDLSKNKIKFFFDNFSVPLNHLKKVNLLDNALISEVNQFRFILL